MEERIRPTKSGLFAIELLIAVGVFTLCAAISMGLFVKAEVMSRDSDDMTRIVAEARNTVECWKAVDGDFRRAAELCGGEGADTALSVIYDENWNRLPAPAGSEAAPGEVYRINMAGERMDGYVFATLWVVKRGEASELLNWTDLAALEAAS